MFVPLHQHLRNAQHNKSYERDELYSPNFKSRK